MTSPARIARRSAPVSIRRRRSPSVKMPATRPPASHDGGEAEALAASSRAASSAITVPASTRGTASPLRIRSATCMSSLRPRLPPGCERAKSSSRKPRASSSATASASPSAICAVVLAVGARLSGHASWSTALESDDVGMTAEAALDVAGHRDQRHAEALDRRHDRGDLVALARVRDREDDVAGRHHAEIAVARLAGVDEERRRAGRRQRRRDLAADVAALAHAHHDDAAAAGEDRAERGDEASPWRSFSASSARASMSSVARASASARSASKEDEAGTVIA